MKNTPIRIIVVLGLISLMGIIFTQVFWVSKAIKNQEEQFSHNVQMSMRNVAEALCEINGNDIPNDPIDQISSNYFIARTDNSIDLSSLGYLLRAEFQKRHLDEDFEYGVYDCLTSSMVYGESVIFGTENTKPVGKLPELDKDEYYFGVYFPNRGVGLGNDLGFWKFTSLLIVLITVFFGYAMFVILRQRRLSEIQRDFINNMTHEFKTPLSSLILSAEVLEDAVKTPREQKYVAIIKSESNRLLDHVSRFLDTTKIDYAAAEKKESLDINQEIRAVLERFSGYNRTFKVDLSEPSQKILANKDILQKCLFNLLDNAVKYGKNFVNVKTTFDNKYAKIVVENDGETIDPAHRKKVFEKFYRIPKGDTHDVKGFGLGLYFVIKAARAMHGQVFVESNSFTTAFILKIPIIK